VDQGKSPHDLDAERFFADLTEGNFAYQRKGVIKVIALVPASTKPFAQTFGDLT
jgi:hypothetical protein